MPVVEIPKVSTREEAEERAKNFGIDGVPVEIIDNGDGTFAVRATYPDKAGASGPANSPASGGP